MPTPPTHRAQGRRPHRGQGRDHLFTHNQAAWYVDAVNYEADQTGVLDQRVMALLALITQEHQLTISALRSDHSELTASGNVSNHFYGRAMDIAAVDGVSCTDTSPSAPCAQLGYALSRMSPPLHPTELIYCFDLDGIGPAFALPDHCDHIHAGFYGY